MPPRSSVTIKAAWIALFGVLIIALVTIAVPFIENWIRDRNLLQEFEYVGRVIDIESQQPIAGAKITLDLQGVPPIVYTDSEGVYRFSVKLITDISGRVIVNAEGYQTYSRNIVISYDVMTIEDIRLMPIPEPPATELAVAVDLPTDVPVMPPTDIPIPTAPALLRQNCFDTTVWTPYKKNSSVSNDGGCWNLFAWGFTARENEIIIVSPNSPDGEFHGLYTPIENISEISFYIKVDKFDVDPGVTANIGIGIINLDPPGPATSRLIYYHYIPKDSEFYIPMKAGIDGNYQDLIPLTLKFSVPQKVILRSDGPFLTLIFDEKIEMELTIPFEKRAFWISYSIPPSSELIMSIYDLEIK